jgi:chloride channel protein, CIC family
MNPKYKRTARVLEHPLVKKYTALVHEDLSETYSRDLHKWLLIAPLIGVITGLIITLIVEIILQWMWPPLLAYFLAHPVAIIPGLAVGFLIAGLIMQYATPNPNEHSTEEVIRSYHEHQGDIQMRPFVPKLLAAIATVGFGGSAALEGPSIYGGGAIGSWLWTRLRRFRITPRDRRIMLICGAAAGMAAVFRAPLTGLVFALEMPYKDDLAHEALLPSLIASVTSYATLASVLGTQPIFNFAAASSFEGKDLLWSVLLGAICGAVAMVFDITFRRTRTFVSELRIPHWVKMVAGGVLTGFCGMVFLSIFRGTLVPLGPNYEAVGNILQVHHSSIELVTFGVLKLVATLCTLGVGGVSAMFVPLFLTGGSFGVAFANSIVHSPSVHLYAAVGMAAFIAGGYKTPLTAAVFVAEATGGHAYLVPSLIGAAVAYAISGEASVSGDQRLHEGVRIAELRKIPVRDVMQTEVILAEADSTLRSFAESLSQSDLHAAYPVAQDKQIVGVVAMRSLGAIPSDEWGYRKVADITEQHVTRVNGDCDVAEALRLLMQERSQHMLLVQSPEGQLEGILTKSDLLSALTLNTNNGYRRDLKTKNKPAAAGTQNGAG